jgi:hypothetical protein
MKTIPHHSISQSIVRELGATVTNRPSIDHPIPVSVFYRNNPDGSVGWIWPKGNRNAEFPGITGLSEKWTDLVRTLFFSVGLEGLLAHGRLVLYADLPTATYLQKQWTRTRIS